MACLVGLTKALLNAFYVKLFSLIKPYYCKCTGGGGEMIPSIREVGCLLKSDLQKVDWVPFYNQRSVNEAWSMMKSILGNLFDCHAPKISKKVRGKPAPWLNSEVKRLMNERDGLLRKSRRTKNQIDISAYKCMRNKVNAAVRKAKSMYHKKLLKENSTDPNKFWKSIKSIYPTKSSDKQSPQSFEINGDKVRDPSKIANAFCSFFANIVTTLKEKAFPLCNLTWRKQPNLPPKTDKKFMFRKVSKQEVERELKSIKRNKATGLDNLPPGLVKDSAELISAPLTYLINMSLMTSTFPADWKAAKIIPAHKSGARSNCDNYRPISVLPILSTVIEKIVHRQVMEFLDTNKLLSKFQYGFRPKLSTEYAATILFDDIRRSVDKDQLVGAVFVDLSKAFDTISHAILLEKLAIYGIKNNELEWFSDYLFSRKAVVAFNSCLSEEQVLLTGVPQGSIIGPLLFLVSFNDAVEVMEYSSILMYADDTVLYVAGKEIDSIENKLSKEMDNLSEWLRCNELILNLKKGKTESILFGTAQRIAKQRNEPLKVAISQPTPTVINNTTVYKYLGVQVDTKLNLNSHFDKCFKRASGRLRILAKLRSYVDNATASTIYRTMILPTFTYCGILQLKLTNTQINRLSSFHSRSLKIIYGDETADQKLMSAINANKMRACKLVRKCLDKDICEHFQNYFTLIEHDKETRNNNCTLRLPSIKKEYARKSFLCMGAKVYNELPLDIRQTEIYKKFVEKLKMHFI